nr:hypothetical protein [Tanacetum cinerariifolium]
MFRVDRTEFRGTMYGEQLQMEMEEFRTELAMQILDNTFDDDVDEPPVQDLELNVDQVQDHDNYIDRVGEYHEVHKMQNDVQQNYVVDSDAEYTSDSNIIPYEQYVKNNADLMQVQSALYNGNEIVKTNHASAIVHDSEDTLESAKITRKRMLEKMKSPIEHKRMIYESVENGPLIWPTIEKNRVTRTNIYPELSVAEKIQADSDIKATNIILQVENGPLIWPTIEKNGVTRTNIYPELSVAEKIQADSDIKETNIILQGLRADIYLLVNHHRISKEL